MSGVRVEDRDAIRWVTFDRPQVRNAWTRQDVRAATAAVRDVPDGLRAVAFAATGGRAFSAGMHVESFRGLDPDEARRLIEEVRDLCGAARTAPVPTAVAVDGYCLGAALELAMACDFRVASDRSAFGMPEIHVGIPSVVDAALLQQYVGLAKAKEMLLVGDPVPVGELPSLANAVVAPDAVLTVTEELLRRVVRHSATAVASQKRLFETWQNHSLAESIAISVQEFAQVFRDPVTAAHVEAHVVRVRKRR